MANVSFELFCRSLWLYCRYQLRLVEQQKVISAVTYFRTFLHLYQISQRSLRACAVGIMEAER